MVKYENQLKRQELRLGNLIEHGGEVYSISAYSDDMVSLDNENTTGFTAIKNIKPIPLTEDWLGKFGFENGGYDLLFWEKGNIEICGSYIDGNGGFAWNWYDSNLLDGKHNQIEVQYVHQLQNLVFALTGEELSIKQTA